jgi:hypothetical protein
MLLGSAQKLGILCSIEITSAFGEPNIVERDVDVAKAFGVEVGLKLVALMAVVEGLDGLLKGDGDEEADGDGGDVQEKVSPGVGGGVGWVDV